MRRILPTIWVHMCNVAQVSLQSSNGRLGQACSRTSATCMTRILPWLILGRHLLDVIDRKDLQRFLLRLEPKSQLLLHCREDIGWPGGCGICVGRERRIADRPGEAAF